jgi:hypothetical protein
LAARACLAPIRSIFAFQIFSLAFDAFKSISDEEFSPVKKISQLKYNFGSYILHANDRILFRFSVSVIPVARILEPLLSKKADRQIPALFG